jgi:hypothetical protein
MDSLVGFPWTPGSTEPHSVLPINRTGVYIPVEPDRPLGFFHQTVAAPLTLLSQICDGISKSNRENFKLATPLDSSPFRTSDPHREFLNSRGNVQGISFKFSFARSPNAVVSMRNALGNHLHIHPRTLAHDLVVFCWLNLLIHGPTV